MPLSARLRHAAVIPVRHVVYLHGFASSPPSGKAQWFARALAAHGITMACPDLNLPEFETLTVTRMIGQAPRRSRHRRVARTRTAVRLPLCRGRDA
jgi:hypothetical protein